MNTDMIRFILSGVLASEGAFMVIPIITALLYHEEQGVVYLAVGAAAIVIGLLGYRKKPKNSVFYFKDGCVATSLSWIMMSLVGALPFVVTGEIPNYLDALFETVSGFTTTGASILNDVEILSRTSLMWRSLTHWIGGMGVLVFLLMILPLGGGSNMNLMRAESPGPSVGKLVPTMKGTARILYMIYIGLALMELILLLCGGMSLFDALTTTFGTAGTGGFGIYNDSCASFSPYCQWVITVFMIIFAVNFNAYYFILFRQYRKAFEMEEVRAFFGIVIIAILLIFVDIVRYMGAGTALRESAFQVASIISSTGFSTCDFDQWSSFSRTLLVCLMFIGACAGSTGGGMKVSRFVIAFKAILKELKLYIVPRSVHRVYLDQKPVEHEVLRSVNVFITNFAALFVLSLLLVSIEGYDLTTNFTAVAATFNNIGPGLSLAGPTENFGFFSPLSKLVFIADMLAGRLELFPLLILFHPTIWKEAAHSLKKV